MRLFIIVFLFSLLYFKSNAQLSTENIAASKEVIRAAEKTVTKYHAGSTLTDNIIKVVYFYANDRQPLHNWNERLSRTLTAVSDFYKEEFARYDIRIDGVNFERSGKKYVITLVKGDLDSKSYGVNSGPQLQTEINKKTGGKIDFTKDFVLIMTGLTDIREDGTYVVHSPYMGMGSSERGVCLAADCELLDPKFLSDTLTRMKFSEHLAPLKECSVAEFNSWYIGGIAHEMGHLFGLHHDFGNPAELNSTDISLMGQYGSRHFKGYLWGDSQSSHFSAAGILQLLSHPIFTRSRKNINTHTSLDLSDFTLGNNSSGITLNTNIKADEPPYALSVLLHPMAVFDYFSQSTVYGIAATGPLRIPLGQCTEGTYVITFIFMFPNGTLQVFDKIFTVYHDGGVSIADFPIRGPVNIQAFYDRLLKNTQTPEVQQKLKILAGIIYPDLPVEPAVYTGKRLYLSDAKWETASVGWEKVARNYFTTESESTFFLENQGKLYDKGLFAHSPSVYSFRLNKQWKKFSAIVGLRDYAGQQGAAKFIIMGDGRILYQSPALLVGQQDKVNIDITNVNLLELKANNGKDNNFNSWAVWLDPLVERQ